MQGEKNHVLLLSLPPSHTQINVFFLKALSRTQHSLHPVCPTYTHICYPLVTSHIGGQQRHSEQRKMAADCLTGKETVEKQMSRQTQLPGQGEGDSRPSSQAKETDYGPFSHAPPQRFPQLH